MALFVAERYVPVSAQADANCMLISDRLAETGGIRFLHGWLLPSDETCLALFEAPSAELLRHAGEAAGLSYRRISEAVEAG